MADAKTVSEDKRDDDSDDPGKIITKMVKKLRRSVTKLSRT
jgi:hypothetical protein